MQPPPKGARLGVLPAREAPPLLQPHPAALAPPPTRGTALAPLCELGLLTPAVRLNRRWHFGNCTHRPNGWNYDTCCDCTHFCFSPAMWGAHLHSLLAVLRRTAVAEKPAETVRERVARGAA